MGYWLSHKSRIINALHGQNISAALMQSTAGSTFIYFLRDNISFLTNTFFKFTTAPLAMFVAVLDIIFTWRLFYLEKSGHTLTNAIVHTLTNLALLTAAIGLTIGVSIFSVIAPILFAAALGLQSLHQASTAIYFYYQAHNTSNYLHEKDAFLHTSYEAIGNAILSGILAALIAALLLVAAPIAQIALASIALSTAIGAIIHCGIKSWQLSYAQAEIKQNKSDLYSTAIIMIAPSRGSSAESTPNPHSIHDITLDEFSHELPTLTATDSSNSPLIIAPQKTINSLN